MDFPKKQAQRLMPLYLLEYSEKLFTNHPDPSAPWGGGGGSDYTAGQGITITNNEISVDTNIIATKSDISSMVTTTQLNDALDDYALKTEIPTDVSQLYNDAGYATQTWVQNQGYATSSDIPTNYVTTDTEQIITGLKTIGQTSGTISEVDFSGFTFKLSNKAINHPEADIKIRNASYDGYQYPTIYSTKGLYVNLAKIKLGDDGNNTYGITMPDSSTWETDRVLATTNDIPTVNNPTITFTQGGATKGSITLNQSGDQTIEFDAGASLPDSPFLQVDDPQDQMFFSLDGSDYSWLKYVDLSEAPGRIFHVNLSALNPVFKDGLTSTYNEQTSQLEVSLNAVIPDKTSDLINDSGYATETWVQNQGYVTSSEIPTNYVTIDTNQTITGFKDFDAGKLRIKRSSPIPMSLTFTPEKFLFIAGDGGKYFYLPTSKPSGTSEAPTEYTFAMTDDIPTTATSTSTSTVTPTTGTFVTGTSTNTTNVVNSVTYTPSSETLTFTYADNTTASFTFLTSSTTVTSGTTSVVTSVTDSTSNAMTGATVSTSTTTTLS